MSATSIEKIESLLCEVVKELRGLRADLQSDKPDGALLSQAEFADVLGVGQRTFRRWRTEPGRIPKPLLAGRYPRWRREDVDAFVARLRKRA